MADVKLVALPKKKLPRCKDVWVCGVHFFSEIKSAFNEVSDNLARQKLNYGLYLVKLQISLTWAFLVGD
jgi:hypothetical protein